MEVPLHLAEQIRRENDITGAATEEQLLQACRRRGCHVQYARGLQKPGYYAWTDYGPLIVLRAGAGPHVIAHELYHHLIRDNAEADLELPESEEEARLFAEWVCTSHTPAHPLS